MLSLEEFKQKSKNKVSVSLSNMFGGQDPNKKKEYTETGSPTDNCDWKAYLDDSCCTRTDFNCCVS